MPPRIKDYLSKIKQSGEHLLGILNDILDFSKIESGKMEIESVAFELDSVISHVVNLSSEKAASKGLELLCHVHSEVPRTLIGDPLRIGQILINMTNNAVKFTRRGEVRIDISVQKGGDTQVVILFKVQDTGIGLTLEQTGNLFRNFAQADTSITRKYGGTGLGLAISKNLAQAMGGHIGVDSVYGEGSTFWLCVPLGVRALAQPLRSSSTLEDQLAHLGGARILLVEDNEINQLVASELLQHAGFLVDVAENGQIAVHQVQARDSAQLPYDIVLMDMQMPVMDGVSAARLIRPTHSAAQLPIVAMTANAMKADRDRCMQVGMNGVVTKPINPEELWKALLTWVKVRDGIGAIAPAPQKTQATESDVQDVLHALRAIPGLDVPLGMLRTNDNPTFYVSLLRKFVVAQEGVATQIRHLWDSADRPTAERMAHTLKGVAGNLGATAVQARAEVLESALRRGDSAVEVDSALVQVAKALDALFDALKATDGFTRTEAALPAQSLTQEDRKAALHITQQIKLLLANDDPQAQELWETHAALLQAVCAHASAVQAAINAFAFEEALQLLNAPNGPEGA